MDPMPTHSAYFDETPTTPPAAVLANLERRVFTTAPASGRGMESIDVLPEI